MHQQDSAQSSEGELVGAIRARDGMKAKLFVFALLLCTGTSVLAQETEPMAASDARPGTIPAIAVDGADVQPLDKEASPVAISIAPPVSIGLVASLQNRGER